MTIEDAREMAAREFESRRMFAGAALIRRGVVDHWWAVRKWIHQYRLIQAI